MVYRADDEGDPGPWRSPMFMPRRHARLWFDVVALGAEPLQAITGADAWAEGVRAADADEARLRSLFADRWDALHARRAPWRANPTVWRIALALRPPTPARFSLAPCVAPSPPEPR